MFKFLCIGVSHGQAGRVAMKHLRIAVSSMVLLVVVAGGLGSIPAAFGQAASIDDWSDAQAARVRDSLKIIAADSAEVPYADIVSSPGALSQPTISFWYGNRQTFRFAGVSQRWANILGNVSDPDGVASLRYTLNGGPQVALAIGPDTRRLLSPGDFNVDLSWLQLDPLPDSNSVVVTATDSLSNVQIETVMVFYHTGTQWPLPWTVGWTSAASLTDSAQVVDGQWARDGDGVRTIDIGYDRLIAVGDTLWSDYEIRVPVTIHSIDTSGYNPVSRRPVIGLLLHWLGHTDDPKSGWQPKAGWNPSGALGMYAYNAPADGGERLEIWNEVADLSGKKLQLGETYYFKMRVDSQAGGTFYGLRVWGVAEEEPVDWDLTFLDAAEDAPQGSFLLLAHHVDATFGPVLVVPDSIALPITLADFTWSLLDNRYVQLSWETVSEIDNYGFEVEKARARPKEFYPIPNSFVPGHGTTILPQSYTFIDSGTTSGTWYYRLKQIDLDGSVHFHDPIRADVGTITAAGPDEPLPVSFSLEQNFPNPFNPSTTIEFSLPEQRHVTLAVYDMLGREVGKLVGEVRPAGVHQVQFDAAGLAGGTYFYRFRAGEFTSTKMLMLLK
jgi:hypothetical protein